MALHYDFSMCNSRESFTDRDMHMLDRLIWGTMVVDLGRITNANIEEWLFRMRFGDAVLGEYFVMRYPGEEPVKIGPEHLRKFVNLTTNVSDKTRKQWLKKVVTQASERIESRVCAELQKELQSA